MNLGTAGPHPEREGRAPPQGLAMRRNPPGLPADAFAAHECWLDGGRWGRVRALSFTPQGPATAQPPATVLHWHGGGFRLGKPEYVAAYAQALATACGVTVICPQYRLAPDHPFPAALNDVAAALAGVLAQNTGAPLILSGDSAGGALAAGAAVLCGEQAIALAGLVLLSAWLDLSVTNPCYGANAATDPLFSADSAQEAAEQYLQGHDPRDPRASPLFANPQHFPPSFLSVGTGEVLAGDTLALHARLTAAGRPVRISQIDGMEHVAVTRGAGLVGAEQTFAQVVAFVRDCAQAAAKGPVSG